MMARVDYALDSAVCLLYCVPCYLADITSGVGKLDTVPPQIGWLTCWTAPTSKETTAERDEQWLRTDQRGLLACCRLGQDPYVLNSRGNCYNSLGRWEGGC
jgi:hypothetical protein